MDKKKMSKPVQIFVVICLLAAAYMTGSKVNVSVVCEECGHETQIVGGTNAVSEVENTTNSVSTNIAPTNAVSK